MNTDTDTKKKEELKLEEIFEKLEEITGKLESGDLSLEESVESYEAGMKLVREAGTRIDTVEKKIQILAGEEEE